MSLAQEILNLPVTLDEKHGGWDRKFFELGHRDVRHAAAELAAKREGELLHVLRAILQSLPSSRDWLNPDIERLAKELVK